ncbi:MAG: hypothetical protein IGQ45_02290 [Cyanobacterium sp. T60_A2020_053]|nr:hypothetical protein [Cyanobacterium sp. T60_A2020_053]
MQKYKLISLVLSSSFLLLITPKIEAQTNNSSGNNPFQNNEQNSLYGDSFNPMDLIHNANRINRLNSADFVNNSDRKIDQEAQNFRQQQQQRILEMRQQKQTEEEIN